MSSDTRSDDIKLDQILTLLVLAAVVVVLILDRLRADVVALSGAAVLLMAGVVRPTEVQGAFASPAIIALASLDRKRFTDKPTNASDMNGPTLCLRQRG